jgi:serine/threonine protein kinase
VSQQDYSFKVDWWALGVLFYEIMFGCSPFWDESVEMTVSNILHGEPDYPKFGHKLAIDLIQRLLAKDPADRIDVDEIKAHPFFHGVDWDRVLKLEVAPASFRGVANETARDSDFATKQPSGFSFDGPE